jgi:hypothetical protein
MTRLNFPQIDWQEVANQLDITNGHAARMRYSRFKAQMEGTPSQTRKPRVTGPRQKKTKRDKPQLPESTQMEGEQPSFKAEFAVRGESIVKAEPGMEDGPMNGIEEIKKAEPVIKEEQRYEDEATESNAGSVGARAADHVSSFAAMEVQQGSTESAQKEEVAHQALPAPAPIEQEPLVKAEPLEEA